jgi:O-antigen/teichoic acid export membrane protein
MAVISLPVLAVAVVLADPIIRALFGAEFQRSAGVLPILAGAFVAICYGNLAGYLAPVANVQWRITAHAFVGAVANVVLNVLLIPRYGAVGSAWATVVTEGLTMSLLLVTGLRALRLRLSAARILRALLAVGMMAGAMLLARPLGLVPALVAGGVVYTAALLALRVVRSDELRGLRRGKEAA